MILCEIIVAVKQAFMRQSRHLFKKKNLYLIVLTVKIQTGNKGREKGVRHATRVLIGIKPDTFQLWLCSKTT